MLAGEQRLQHRMHSFKAVEWEAYSKLLSGRLSGSLVGASLYNGRCDVM
jgi:hypothetical protein